MATATEHTAERAMATTGKKLSQLFPLSPKEGWTQWCANMSPATAEETVLSFIPDVLKPSSSQAAILSSSQSSITSSSELGSSSTSSLGQAVVRKWHSRLVQLGGKDRALNEFSIERVGEEVEHNLVMLHGYGAGLGFFYKNYESLSRRPGWKLYALDMLGMGRSSRPPFRIQAKDRQGKVTEAENWFIDALEEWRVKKGIGRMTLLGHSMGGYMATAYALKYPNSLEKLILVSPVGIPEDPSAIKSEIPELPANPLRDQNIALDSSADISPSSVQQTDDNNRKPLRQTPKWLVHLWEANISPFSIIRMAGPLGPRLTSGWTSRVFSHLPQNEALALHDYSYSLFRQRGSGEYALAHILAPGAFARDPLINRIHKIGRQEGEKGVPVTFMYGDHDWMDVNGGRAAEKIIKAESAKALEGKSDDEKRKDNGDAKVVVIEKAGHHLYIDNPERFNRVIDEELQDVERRQW